MLRYIIGITLITAGLILIRALSNGKILKKHQYALWLIIPAFMILFPLVKFVIPAALEKTSAEADSRRAIPSYVMVDGEYIKPQEIGDQYMYHELLNDIELIEDREQLRAIKAAEAAGKTAPGPLFILACAYCFVTASLLIALAAYNTGFIAYCRRRREYVGRDPASGLKIYRIRHNGAPFLLFNKIYLDRDSGKTSDYTICHEASHYKHGDHIWVLVRYIVLILNWYNPVIWAAFILSGRDCELACDEEVLRTRGIGASAGYVNALLDTLKKNTGKNIGFALSTGMGGGYKMMKKRISNIKKPARNSRKALALTLAAVFAFSGCSLILPDPSESSIEETANTSETTNKETVTSVSDTTDAETVPSTSDTTEETTEDLEEIVNKFPTSYKNKIGKCTFDIDKLDCPEELVFHKTTVKNKASKSRQFAEETVKGLPCVDREDTQEIYCVDEKTNKWYYCFSIVDSDICFLKYDIPYLDSVYLDFESENYNLDKYTKPKTFAFGSAEEVYDKTADMFGKYGIDIKTGMTVETYYLDHETLDKESLFDEGKSIKRRNWTADDDAYLYVVKQSVQGVPISPTKSILWPGSFHALSDARYVLIVNKDGLHDSESWNNHCEFKLSPATEKLLTFDELSQSISDYLAYKSSSAKYTVTKAKLFATHDYISNQNDSKPIELYWGVWVKENNNGKVTEYELRFDAKTGEIAPRLADG